MPSITFDVPRFVERDLGQSSVLYFLKSGQFLKIGIAADIERRLATLRCENPHGIEVAASLAVPKCFAFQIERMVHSALHAERHAGEWFLVTDDEAIRIAKIVVAAGYEAEAGWAALKLARALSPPPALALTSCSGA